MKQASNPVRSNQRVADPGLQQRQQRRQGTRYRRPLAPHNLAVYRQLQPWLQAHAGRLLLDAGCGTGQSSLNLASRHPDCVVLGADKSLQRLRQRGLSAGQPLHIDGRCAFALIDLVDLWRLLAADGIAFRCLYLLYPNPWPKPAQRLRRWPLHPVWPELLSLAPRLELRSNWAVLAAETHQALEASGWSASQAMLPVQDEPISPFEAKYQASGHALWQVLGARAQASGHA